MLFLTYSAFKAQNDSFNGRLWVWMYNCGIIPVVLYHYIIQHSHRSIVLYNTPKVEQRPNAFIVAHKLSWASTTSRPGSPLCSIRNNLIVKLLQQVIQSFASGCSISALIADMKLNLKRTPSTRMRMVVVVALMNLIVLTYPRVSMACMPRISSRPRSWWTRVTSTNEVLWVLYNTFGIIQYYTMHSAKIPIIQTHSDPPPGPPAPLHVFAFCNFVRVYNIDL